MDVSGSMRTTCLEAREKESNLTDYRIVYMPNVLQNVLFLGEFFFFFLYASLSAFHALCRRELLFASQFESKHLAYTRLV